MAKVMATTSPACQTTWAIRNCLGSNKREIANSGAMTMPTSEMFQPVLNGVATVATRKPAR